MPTMMRIDDILQYVTHSADITGPVDWFAIMANKVSHSHFDWLCDEIMEYGFTLPIVLMDNGDDTYTLGNGHHRLCAAILLGLHAIPVIILTDDYTHEDSHDGNITLPAASWDYWELLCQNMEGDHVGDCLDTVFRRQYLPTDYANDDYNDYPYEGECAYCNVPNGNDTTCHLIGCPERDWEIIYCECVQSFYRAFPCVHFMNMWHDEAIAMNEGRMPIAA